MSEHRAPYLSVVRSAPPIVSASLEGAEEVDTAGEASATSATVDSQPAPPPLEDGASSAATELAPAPSATPLAQAVMYAVVSWLALCVERVAVAVDIQPIAERLYEVSAHFDEEHTQGIILRVRLDLEPGLVVRTTVEPIRP